jgi:Ca2+-binding EF-hand superfamily protein
MGGAKAHALEAAREAAVYRILLITLGLLAGTAAAAQTPQVKARGDVQKQIDANFDKGDTNNDGFLNRAEIQAMTSKALDSLQPKLEAEFKVLDKDGNGQISLAEFKSAAAAKLAQNPELTLSRFDSNKDGKVSGAEFRAPVMAAFDKVDTNKDGKVTADEAKKAQSRR